MSRRRGLRSVAVTDREDVIAVSWKQTRRRWQVLREIEQDLDPHAVELPWQDEYAALFGTPEGLLAMLRYRSRLAYDAQLDSHLPEHVLEEQRRRLDARLAGVRSMLESHDAKGSGDAAA